MARLVTLLLVLCTALAGLMLVALVGLAVLMPSEVLIALQLASPTATPRPGITVATYTTQLGTQTTETTISLAAAPPPRLPTAYILRPPSADPVSQ